MNCERSRKNVALFVGADLSSTEMQAMRAHLDVCGACTQLVDQSAQARNWLIAGDQQWHDATVDAGTVATLKAALNRAIELEKPRPWAGALLDALLGRGHQAGRMGLLIGFGTATIVALFVALSGPDAGSSSTSKPLSQQAPQVDIDAPHVVPRDEPLEDENWRVHWTKDPGEFTDEPVQEPIELAAAETNQIEIPSADPRVRIIWLAQRESEGP